MEHFLQLLSTIGIMLSMIAIGYGAAWSGIISAQGRKCVTNLVIDIIYPCYIINGFVKNIGQFAGKEMLSALLLGFLIQGSLLLCNCFLYRKTSPGRRAVLRYCTAISNSAFLGMPMVESIMGSQGLVCASVFIIPQRINTFGVAINYFAISKVQSAAKRLRDVFRQPAILATAAGVLILLAGWYPPAFCRSILTSVAACSTPLSMMTVGMVLHAYSKEMRLRKITLEFTFLRLVLIPLILYLALRLAGAPRLLLGVAVLMAAMPAGTTAALLADKYDADVSFAGELVLVSTLCSLVTLPLWSYLCLYG